MDFKFKARFNLQAGKHFKHWLIENLVTKEKFYYDPEKVCLKFSNCQLKVDNARAKHIFNGGEKTGCAYVFCEDYQVLKLGVEVPDHELHFNPRITPHWRDDHDNNVNNLKIKEVVSLGKSVFYKLVDVIS